MTQPNVPSIAIAGNVEGNIVVGDNNFVVNTNYGTIVYKEAAPRVQLRGMAPQAPRKPRGFIGRARELGQLEAWIASGEPAYVHGAPGLGKTSLAKLAANGAAAHAMPNGVIFLEGIDNQGTALGFGDLVQGMFDAAYESEPPLKVDIPAARTYLSNLRALVLLSGVSLPEANLETLLDLFPNAPILIDTEGRLPGDAFTDLDLGPLPREESTGLLAEKAALSGMELPANSQAEFAELLYDIPGALTTLANALREKRITPGDALEKLRAAPQSDGSASEKAMDRVYRVVLGCLTEDERSMLVQTGAAPGISVDRGWLEKVCGGKPVSEALEALELLQANSPRLRLAPGLSGVALEEQDVSSARERLLDELKTALGQRGTDFNFVHDELGNLIGLLEWCISKARWADALALVRGLDPFLTLHGRWDAWGRAVQAAEQAATALGDEEARAWSLHQMGTWQIGRGDYQAARQLLEKARDLRQTLGDEIGVAYSQHNLDLISAGMAPPQSSTTVRAPRRWPWIMGAIIALVLVVLLFGPAFGLHLPFGLSRAPQPSPTATPTSTASVTMTVSPSPQATASGTATPTASLTATASPTSSPSITPSPTYVSTLSGAMLEHAYCFYGPSRDYIPYGWGLLTGQTVSALGRNETGSSNGNWVYVVLPNFIDQRGKPGKCWFAANTMQLSGDVMSLQPIYPDIVGPPISSNPVNYPHLQNIQISRSGDLVTITWNPDPIPSGDDAGAGVPLYMAELWLCQGGQLVFTPIGLSTERLVVNDAGGCSMPSHGRLMRSEKHGYIGPEDLKWPPAPAPTSSPSASPTQ